MKLLQTRKLNGVQLNIYEDDEDVWVTRQSLGEILGYENPTAAIEKIHEEHKERLDKFSKVCQIPDKNETTTFYSFKGVLETCRWSHRPEANDIFDGATSLVGGIFNG